MYVEDIDDLDELQDMLEETVDRIARARSGSSDASADAYEQAQWDHEDIQRRIEELEAELAFARRVLTNYTPVEPEAVGSVVRFVKYNLSYTFAALKVPNGLWYVTQDGSRSARQGHPPKTWSELLDWIGQRNWHRIEVLG